MVIVILAVPATSSSTDYKAIIDVFVLVMRLSRKSAQVARSSSMSLLRL